MFRGTTSEIHVGVLLFRMRHPQTSKLRPSLLGDQVIATPGLEIRNQGANFPRANFPRAEPDPTTATHARIYQAHVGMYFRHVFVWHSKPIKQAKGQLGTTGSQWGIDRPLAGSSRHPSFESWGSWEFNCVGVGTLRLV